MRTLLITGLVFCYAAMLGVAYADRTTVALSTQAKVDTVLIQRDDPGTGFTMSVCGHTLTSDGGVTVPECYSCSCSFPLSAASVLSCFKTGAGL